MEGGERAQVSIKVMPSPIASLTAALSALLEEPCGCFEQTSSTTYPTIMALGYFRGRPDTPVELVQRAEGLLEKGYRRLVGFEVKESGGFEWFGAAPAHEALTAYGLALFLDMRKVWQPAEGMEAVLSRTREFLRKRRDDPAASFFLDPKHLDNFGGAPANVARAYILWSLSAEKEEATGLDAQVAALDEEALKSEDPYVIALAAGTLFNLGRNGPALMHAKRLLRFREADGKVARAPTSITSSQGDALLVETTSLAVLAWIQAGNGLEAETRGGVEWLAGQCQGGRFGSTQATVLALKAIVAYEARLGRGDASAVISLLVDDTSVARRDVLPGVGEVVAFNDIPETLKPGPHRLRLVSESDGAEVRLPYAATLRYRSTLPLSCPGRRLGLQVRRAAAASSGDAEWGGPAVAEGEVDEILVSVFPEAPPPLSATDGSVGAAARRVEEEAVDADAGRVLGMTVAVVGLPGGLEPRFDQLQELRRTGKVDYFELLPGNEVVLYWRFLKERRDVRLEALAGVPGQYRGRVSRAYEYYNDNCKAWASAALAVTVSQRP